MAISRASGRNQACNFGFRNISQENLLEALVAHPPRDGSGISSESGNGHANMVVDGKDLLLMTGRGEE